MKLFFLVFNLSALAGFFSPDFKQQNDPKCFLDLKRYAGTFTEANFSSSYKGLGVRGPIIDVEEGRKRVTIPDRHIFNCLIHKKDSRVRVCEGGDEVIFKNGGTFVNGMSVVHKVDLIRPKGKFFELYTKDGKKFDSDKIEKVVNNFNCRDRQRYSDGIYGKFIRSYYNDMYIGDLKRR